VHGADSPTLASHLIGGGAAGGARERRSGTIVTQISGANKWTGVTL
jgi:hypothetical protein